MSYGKQLICDICGEHGHNQQGGWVELRNFAYVKHACPDCVSDTDDYGGSTMRDERLRQKILQRG